jgi:hypothetical protein
MRPRAHAVAGQLADGLLDSAHLLKGEGVPDGQRLVCAGGDELRGNADYPGEGDAKDAAVMDLVKCAFVYYFLLSIVLLIIIRCL